MPLCDPREFRALVQAAGGAEPAARRLRRTPGWVVEAAEAPPLWAVVVLRRARHEGLALPPGVAEPGALRTSARQAWAGPPQGVPS